MVPVIVGRSPSELERRTRAARASFPRLPEDARGWRNAGFLYGTPGEVAGDLRNWRERGIQRVMLQLIDLDDLDAVELIARAVLPALR